MLDGQPGNHLVSLAGRRIGGRPEARLRMLSLAKHSSFASTANVAAC